MRFTDQIRCVSYKWASKSKFFNTQYTLWIEYELKTILGLSSNINLRQFYAGGCGGQVEVRWCCMAGEILLRDGELLTASEMTTQHFQWIHN